MSRLDFERANRKPSGTEEQRPTTGQLQKLAGLGVTVPPRTRSEASAVIDRELRRQGKKRAWAT